MTIFKNDASVQQPPLENWLTEKTVLLPQASFIISLFEKKLHFINVFHIAASQYVGLVSIRLTALT